MNDNILLRDMAESARGTFDILGDRISSVEEMLRNRVDGKSEGRMILDIVLSALWVVFYVVLLILGVKAASSGLVKFIVIIGAIGGILLSALLVFNNYRNYNYYGAFLGFLGDLKKIRDSLQRHIDGIPAELDTLTSAGRNRWGMSLPCGESVPDRLDQMEETVEGIGFLKNKTIKQLIQTVFFVVSIIGTFTIGYVVLSFFMNYIIALISGSVDLEDRTIRTILYVVLTITSIASLWLARWWRTKSKGDITNYTMLAPVIGGVGVLAVIAALILIALLIYLALVAIGVVLGIVCLCGAAGGG